PFWIELLHCNIHDTITPDILHQIYQGLVRHISDAELDACFKCMPHVHGIHLFSHGISGLNKDVFINLGARNSEDFNFTKLHSLKHYANSIHHFGMTDNYNTEATEHLRIDYAKDAYRATNKKESLQQMTRWLE
ncbi:hypothetical protein BDR04DRAFT_1018713, partial [Suillus decipiens]